LGVGCLSDANGLQHTEVLDGCREFFERCCIEMLSRLVGIGLDEFDGYQSKALVFEDSVNRVSPLPSLFGGRGAEAELAMFGATLGHDC
jgi:hypothetical protein